MAKRWEARTNSDWIDIGTLVRVNEGVSASAPPEALMVDAPIDLVTTDGLSHHGIVAVAMPGNIVLRLADITVFLLPTSPGSWSASADDGRYTDWIVDRIETNLHRDDEPADAGIPETEAANHDFSEGQLPGLPVSRDPLREPGPTPGLTQKPAPD